jgi:hypothetical protein
MSAKGAKEPNRQLESSAFKRDEKMSAKDAKEPNRQPKSSTFKLYERALHV